MGGSALAVKGFERVLDVVLDVVGINHPPDCLGEGEMGQQIKEEEAGVESDFNKLAKV